MKQLKGCSVAGGVAAAPLFWLNHTISAPAPARTVSPRAEQARLTAALDAAGRELDAMELDAAGSARGIFAFQACLLEDEGILSSIRNGIESGLSAEAAVHAAGRENAGILRGMPDNVYMNLRAADILDATARVEAILAGQPRRLPITGGPVILAARTLYPSDLVSAPAGQVCGFAAFGGNAESHAAILARSLGLPAVLGLSDAGAVLGGEDALLDGDAGILYLSPDTATRESYRARTAAR